MKRYEPDERVILTPLNLPRVRHRRKEAAMLAAILTTVVAGVFALAFAIVWLLS